MVGRYGPITHALIQFRPIKWNLTKKSGGFLFDPKYFLHTFIHQIT